MSLPSSGYPLAAAISPRLQASETVDSTNARLLADVAADPAGHPHLSVLLTRDQRAGRGRLDRTWTAPPGSALAVSVLLRVEALPVAGRGWIPLLAGEAMTRAVAAQLPGRDVALKWPNDVLAGARKICGILAEVVPGDPFAVVVGAGVNTRMPEGELPVPTATSFAVHGVEADEDRLLADYLTGLRDGIAELAVRGPEAVADGVRSVCATLGADVTVSLPDGEVMTGAATGIDDEGRLVVQTDAGERTVAAGDVVHVRQAPGEPVRPVSPSSATMGG
jgi:BirA family biotin operon repressor/biotin-[acetyl-CoA-carboxylase] ligase